MSVWTPQVPMGLEQSIQTSRTTITASGTAHTKGSWTQLVASAPFDVAWVGIETGDTAVASTDTSQLLDIGIGASASEKVLIPNVLTGYGALRQVFNCLGMFPIAIPEGTRISARVQAAVTSDTVDVALHLYSTGPWLEHPYHAIDDIGTSTSTSGGTDLEPDGIQQLIASTAEAYKALTVVYDMGGGTLGGSTDGRSHIYIGAASSEKKIIQEIFVGTGAGESVDQCVPPQGTFYPLALDIPAGTRISADYAGARDLGIALYGFR